MASLREVGEAVQVYLCDLYCEPGFLVSICMTRVFEILFEN